MKTPVEFGTNLFTTTAGISPCTPAHERTWSAIRLSTVLALTLFSSGLVRASQSASLAWSPVTNSFAAGYACYFGRTSGVYTSRFDVGTNTDITLSGLKEGHHQLFCRHLLQFRRIGSSRFPPGFLSRARACPVHAADTTGRLSDRFLPRRGGALVPASGVHESAGLDQPLAIPTSLNLKCLDHVSGDPAFTGKFSRRFYRLIMN